MSHDMKFNRFMHYIFLNILYVIEKKKGRPSLRCKNMLFVNNILSWAFTYGEGNMYPSYERHYAINCRETRNILGASNIHTFYLGLWIVVILFQVVTHRSHISYTFMSPWTHNFQPRLLNTNFYSNEISSSFCTSFISIQTSLYSWSKLLSVTLIRLIISTLPRVSHSIKLFLLNPNVNQRILTLSVGHEFHLSRSKFVGSIVLTAIISQHKYSKVFALATLAKQKC